MIDRCCLYLLGEMPAAEADDFQRECASSVELQACLSQQAELIAGLGVALAPLQAAHPQTANSESRPATAALPLPEPEPSPGWGISQWLTSRGASAAALALAATLLLWVGLQRNAEFAREDAPETLQLAHAWAAGRGEAEEWTSSSSTGSSSTGSPESSSQWRSEPWEDAELTAEGAEIAADLAAEEAQAAAGESGPPQWLIVAVRALDAEARSTVQEPFAAERSANAAEVSDE